MVYCLINYVTGLIGTSAIVLAMVKVTAGISNG